MNTYTVNSQGTPAYLTGFRSTLQAALPQAPSMDTIAPAHVDSFSLSGSRDDRAGKPGLVELMTGPHASPLLEGKNEAPAAAARVETVTIRSEENGSEIDMSYPQLRGGIGEEVQKTINSGIEGWSRAQIKSFTEDARWAIPVEDMGSSFQGNFSGMANNDRFISFTAETSCYVGGWAHPSHMLYTFNFDTKTGKPIYFNELFALPGEDVETSHLFRDNQKAEEERQNAILTRVSDCCIREMNRQNEGKPEGERIDMDSLHKAAAPNLENFDQFNLTDRGLVIHLDFCHAIGYREVTIPYGDLADILNPEGVLGHEAKPVDRKTPGQEGFSQMEITDGMIIIDDVWMKINSTLQ